jgi:F-type H+-transporting ATPase subunit h
MPITISDTNCPSDSADPIQEMYLKELRAYKIPQPKPNDSEGHVQKFTAPTPPTSPEETNLASEMKAYEDQQVEVEGQASTGEAKEPEDDYFEDLKQFDEEHHEGAAH